MLFKNPSGRSIQPQWAVLTAPLTGLAALLVSAGVTPAAADQLPANWAEEL
jgi:hypothetical protein